VADAMKRWQMDERKGRAVELRSLGSLSVEETAEVLADFRRMTAPKFDE